MLDRVRIPDPAYRVEEEVCGYCLVYYGDRIVYLERATRQFNLNGIVKIDVRNANRSFLHLIYGTVLGFEDPRWSDKVIRVQFIGEPLPLMLGADELIPE